MNGSAQRSVNRYWGGSLSRGDVVAVLDEEDLARVGGGWARGKLRVGDVLVCLAHAGDCFYDFALATPTESDHGEILLQGQPRALGAYEFKTHLGRVSEEAVAELARGGQAWATIELPAAVAARLELRELGEIVAPASSRGRPAL